MPLYPATNNPPPHLFVPGYYYANYIGPGFNNATPSNGEEYAMPIDVFPLNTGATPTADRIGIYLTGTVGGTGSVVRLGIYQGSTGRPGTLVLDAGTVAGTSNGWKEITISQSLAPGRYYVSCAAQGSPTPQPTWVGAYNDMVEPIGYVSAPGTGGKGAWYRTGITGALSNWASWGDAAFAPRVAIRVN